MEDDKYEDIVFMEGEEAIEPLAILENEGEREAIEYLKQWHYPGEHDTRRVLSHGTADDTYIFEGYILTYNISMGYIGLEFDLQYNKI